MATTSYPRVGTNGWNADEWSKIFDTGDGISDNTTGTSCAVTMIDANNVARISPGRVAVNGYILDVTTDTDLSVPTAAGTYDICAMYDPTLNVELAGGAANPLGPCRLVCVASPPSTAGGKVYSLMYRITRTTGQALSQATLRRMSQHVGASYRISSFPAEAKTSPETPIVGFDHPVGTAMWDQTTGTTWHKAILPGSTGTFWQRDWLGPFTFPAASGLVSRDPAPSRPQYVRVGPILIFMGTLQRSSGAALGGSTGDVTLGTLPEGDRPPFVQRFLVKIGPGDFFAQVFIQTGGAVIVNGGANGYDYVDLAGITLFAPLD